MKKKLNRKVAKMMKAIIIYEQDITLFLSRRVFSPKSRDWYLDYRYNDKKGVPRCYYATNNLHADLACSECDHLCTDPATPVCRMPKSRYTNVEMLQIIHRNEVEFDGDTVIITVPWK